MAKIVHLAIFGLLTLTSTIIRAEDILAEHKKALGGKEAIDKIKSFRRTAEIEATGLKPTKGTFVEAAVMGKKCYQKTDFNGFGQTMVWDGDKVWNVNPVLKTAKEMKESQLVDFKGYASVSHLVGLVDAAAPAALKAIGEADIGGVKCNAYEIDKYTFYLGKEDNLIHCVTIKVPGLAREFSVKISYFDYKEYEGVKFPCKTISETGDNTNILVVTTYTKTKINPDLDESLFNKPSP